MARKTRVITQDNEIYRKLNTLNFTSTVTIEKGQPLTKVINNINRKEKFIDTEHIGKYVVLKKVKPLDLAVYWQKKKVR